MKKIPMRTCIVSKEKLPKKELIRIVNTADGVIIDETGKVNGHGCYLKRDADIINKAREKKILNRYLEVDVPDSIYDELLEKIK